MIFRFRVKYMDDYLDIPCVWYSLITDDGQKEEGYINKSEDGWFYIETSVQKSGFAYIVAKACDENKDPIDGIALFNASAGADIFNIARATQTPDDYLDFWHRLKAEVEATEPEVIFCEKIEDASYPEFEIYDMHIKAPRSDYASVMVSYPKNAEKNSLKAAFTYQGYGVRANPVTPKKGYLCIAVNAHALPNRENDKFYSDLFDANLRGYGFN